MEVTKLLFNIYKLLRNQSIFNLSASYSSLQRVTVPGSRQSQISVWKVNKPQIWGLVLDEMFKAALNLSLRMAYEQERGEGVSNPLNLFIT